MRFLIQIDWSSTTIGGTTLQVAVRGVGIDGINNYASGGGSAAIIDFATRAPSKDEMKALIIAGAIDQWNSQNAANPTPNVMPADAEIVLVGFAYEAPLALRYDAQ